MKRKITLVTLVFFVFALLTNAQKRVETFENNAFGWEEIAMKKKSAIIRDGYLVLEAKNAKDPMVITTRFPIDVHRSFKITAKFLLPKYAKGIPSFGIVFDESNAVRRFVIGKVVDGKKIKEGALLNINGVFETAALPLSLASKNAEVTLVVENRAGVLFFSVNGMTAFSNVKAGLNTSNWGFVAAGGEVRVDEIIINQAEEKDN